MKRLVLILGAALMLGAAAPVAAPAPAEPPRSRPINPAETAEIKRRVEQLEAQAAARRSEQREVADLAAQQAMARTAEDQLNISIAAAVLAAISIGFTFTALWQTRESLQIARSSAKAELRPYIGVSGFEPGDFADGVKGGTVIRWRIENFGATPASNVRINLRTQIVPGMPYHWVDEAILDEDWSRLRDIPPHAEISWYIAMDKYPLVQRQSLVRGGVSLMVCIVILYDDCFGETHVLTYSDIRHDKKLARHRFNMGFKPENTTPPSTL